MDLKKNSVVNGAAYALATAGVMAAEMRGMQVLNYICAPAMMIILSSWFFFNSRRVGDRFTLLIQAGLFFSLVADIALMFQHTDQFNFLIGLGAYLLAVLCYTMAFIHNVTDISGGGSPAVPSLIALGIGGYAFLFGSRLMPYLDDGISIPIIVMIVLLTCMGIAAALRFGKTFIRSFLMVLLGSFFFIAFFSLLAANRFMVPLEHARWSILLTYSIAQYLIAAGCLLHVLDPEEIRRKAMLST